MRALSIRQPYAELILRGVKTIEYRSRATKIIGERFLIYASKSKLPVVGGQLPVKTADNIVVPRPPYALPDWMLELAEQVGMIKPGELRELPTGVIVGSAVIAKVSQVGSVHRWHLAEIRRAKKLRKPKLHPQPVWFHPF